MIEKVLKNILYRCWEFSLFITSEGSWKLRAIEILILDAVKKHVENDIKELIALQLSRRYFVQRVNGHRVNTFFYEKNEHNRISNGEFNDLLFEVEIELEGAKECSHVTFYKGYVNTVEFKNLKKHYLGKNVKIGEVRLGRPDESYAHVIDHSEHGSDEL